MAIRPGEDEGAARRGEYMILTLSLFCPPLACEVRASVDVSDSELIRFYS
jgi:hypothetical protein